MPRPPAQSGAVAVIEEAATLAAKAAEMRTAFEQAQVEADKARTDRERRQREQAEKVEEERKVRRCAIQSTASSFAVPAATGLNLLYLYQSRARLFTGDGRQFDPISRWLYLGLFGKMVIGPSAGCLGNLIAIIFIIIGWLLHVAIEVLLFIPIAFVIRWVVGFAANRMYPSATGGRLSSIDPEHLGKDFALSFVSVVVVFFGILWLNYSVFPETPSPSQPPVSALGSPGAGGLEGERFPQTRTVYLRESDVGNWSYASVRYAINEIYARHGYWFGSGPIHRQFSRFPWYHPDRGASQSQIDTRLSPMERANAQLLARRRDKLARSGAH